MPAQPPSGQARVVAAIDALRNALAETVTGSSELHAALEAITHPMPGTLAAIDQMAAGVRRYDQLLAKVREDFGHAHHSPMTDATAPTWQTLADQLRASERRTRAILSAARPDADQLRAEAELTRELSAQVLTLLAARPSAWEVAARQFDAPAQNAPDE